MAESIKGTAAALKQLERIKKESKKAMRRGEKKVADQMGQDARALVPVSKGVLKNSIGVEQTLEGTTLFASAKYAPYQEFGTGPLTEAPAGLEEEAFQFFVTGEGNTSPQPFFFPSVFKNQEDILPAVEEELNKLADAQS